MTADVVLTYHRVVEGRDPLLQCVGPDRFAAQLEVLAANADVVSLAELDRPSSRPRAAITFDDGYADNAEVAAPILAAAGLPATFFVTARALESSGEYWWDRLEHLLLDAPPAVPFLEVEVDGRALRVDVRTEAGVARALKALNRRLRTLHLDGIEPVVHAVADQLGLDPAPACDHHRLVDATRVRALASDPRFEVGCHGATHTMLSACSGADLQREVHVAREALSRAAGTPVTSFAYPYGTPGSFTGAGVGAVRSAGFERAFVNTPEPAVGRNRRFRRPRVMVYDWSVPEFARHLAGWLAA